MAFSTVPSKNIGDVFTASMWNTYIRDNINKGVVRPIGDNLLGSAGATITFSSIPTDYVGLMLILVGRGDTAAAAAAASVRFNGDTGTNYYWETSYAQGLALTNGESLANSAILLGELPAGTAQASVAGSVVAYIPNYAGTTYHKQVHADNAHKTGTGTGATVHRGGIGHWQSTSAISSVGLIISAGNFAAGTRATLYGMPG